MPPSQSLLDRLDALPTASKVYEETLDGVSGYTKLICIHSELDATTIFDACEAEGLARPTGHPEYGVKDLNGTKCIEVFKP